MVIEGVLAVKHGKRKRRHHQFNTVDVE